ncbi:MAG TPA: amidohydrolase family protein [Verrucomicrobiae bacterium]
MLNRRHFLGTALVTAAAAAGCATTPPDSGILDTHTHFYDPTRPQGVPWPPKDDEFLYRPVLPTELKRIAQPLGVTGTIVVEASSWVEDNDWILQLARTEPFIKGLVGHLKPGKPNFAADLNRFAADRLFRGIRVGLWDIPLAVESTDFLRDLRLLATRGLSLDVLGGPDEIEKIAKLAAELPDLRIVVDHCAGVRVTGGTPDAKWLSGIKTLAARKNVFMKVSGLVEGTGLRGAPIAVEFYEPVLDALWNSFSEDRVIFGSNWPVSARFASYENVLKIVRAYVKSESAAEKYFRKNAERVYLG